MKFLSGRLIYLFSLLCLLFLLPQCAHICGSGSLPCSSSMSLEDLEKLNEITKKHPDRAVRADAHLKLSAYYLNHKNADYSEALKELESYVALDPEGAKRDSIQNWLVLLREHERTRNKLGQTAKENKEFKDSLERLKTLDIKIEEKRKKVK